MILKFDFYILRFLEDVLGLKVLSIYNNIIVYALEILHFRKVLL